MEIVFRPFPHNRWLQHGNTDEWFMYWGQYHLRVTRTEQGYRVGVMAHGGIAFLRDQTLSRRCPNLSAAKRWARRAAARHLAWERTQYPSLYRGKT